VKLLIERVKQRIRHELDEGLLIEASLFALCTATEDKKEGTTAFLGKRAPSSRAAKPWQHAAGYRVVLGRILKTSTLKLDRNLLHSGVQ